MVADVSPAGSSLPMSRCELDSHANMVVLGTEAFYFESAGRFCDVSPYDRSTVRTLPIKDAALAYDCPYSGTVTILIFRNAIVVPEMRYNLLPPFILREGGVTVNDKAKIHCKDPSREDHSISFDQLNSALHIPLRLNGTFSYFATRKPTVKELSECDKIICTPDSISWNPNCPSFAMNEESKLDFEGNVAPPSRWLKEPMLLDEDPVDQSSNPIQKYIDGNISSMVMVDESLLYHNAPHEDLEFAFALSANAEISAFDSTRIDVCNAMTGTNELFPELNVTQECLISAVADNPSGPSASHLSKLWNISQKQAEGVLKFNTHLCKRPAENLLSRNFSTNDRMLRYRRINSTFFTDALVATSCKSTRGNKYAQVFVSDKGYVSVFPMKTQSEFQDALHWFCKQVGVPSTMVMDGHMSMAKNNNVRRFSHQVGMTIRVLERNTPWSNRAGELYIGLLKEAVRKDLRSTNAPMVLWDYALERRAQIHNLVPRELFQNERPPHEITFGEQADISKLCDFGFYEFVYYRDHGSFPENKEKLGRVLGPSLNEGNEMSQFILNSKGSVIVRRSLRKLTKEEQNSSLEIQKQALFNGCIRRILGDSMSPPVTSSGESLQPYADSVEESLQLPDNNDPVDDNGIAVFEKPITDQMINVELILPQGEEMMPAKVVGRHRDSDGNIVGQYSDNPIANTMLYDVEFSDGTVREYAANVIAENLYDQVDADGYSHSMFDCIVDVRKNADAVPKDKAHVMTKSGIRRLSQSTKGWEFLVRWKDQSEQWVPLKLLKESNPVDVADFVQSRGLLDEVAFRWWVPYTLKKRDRIISAVTSRARRVTHKYGVEIPRTVKEALELDRKNGNTFWRDAINKEMGNLIVAFDILEQDDELPKGYSLASGHMVFDVRMTLERKARWVKDGHKTPDPSWSTYAGVVSRETVRIALTYAALNDLPVCGADIQNAYLQAPSSEKHYIICGEEFGLENVGKRALIRRALYGGKSAGSDYWKHVRLAMGEMGFMSCPADPDLWMRPGFKANGDKIWEYVLLYTDDILAIMQEPEAFLRTEFASRFTLKPQSIGEPSQYLGNKVTKVTLENGVVAWAFSSSQYIQNAFKNVDEYRVKNGLRTLTPCKSPWPSNYRPEADVSPELSPEEASYYQSQIGVLRWVVELGRVDLGVEVSAMASQMAMPRQGHLNALFQMFAFLKGKHNSQMVFDPTVPQINEECFPLEDWSSTPYGNCKETIPHNAPEARGKGFVVRAFVDADHAGDCKTRRSRTGFIAYLNSAPIHWFSKKQTSVETSSFGSEFIAMKQCCEYLRGLRYKLRMMGIPVDGPAYVFGDNQSVLANTTKPHSTLKKKSSSIAYHFVREGVAKDEWRTTYLNTEHNPADLLTKSLPGGEKRTRFTNLILHYVG